MSNNPLSEVDAKFVKGVFWRNRIRWDVLGAGNHVDHFRNDGRAVHDGFLEEKTKMEQICCGVPTCFHAGRKMGGTAWLKSPRNWSSPEHDEL